MNNITILQPHIPHYREEFFARLAEKFSCEIFCYNKKADVEKDNFKESNIKTNFIKSFSLGRLFFYNPMPFFRNDSDILILMIDFKHITTWFLLLTKLFHRKKIILWGQGISIKRFFTDEKKTFLPVKWFLSLSDGVWFYTENELKMWKKCLPKLNAVALNNTISEIDKILNVPEISIEEKQRLKEKYSISQEFIFIYCARFTASRRIDLMLEIIEKLDKEKFGFIIIGDGKEKPSFDLYKNVYDFGSMYDFNIKTELFALSDIYFQPVWVGLSIVEAMAYGKPVFTFKRSPDILQCVEYFYILNDYNGKIFDNTNELVEYLNNYSKQQIKILSQNAKTFAQKSLSMQSMVENAISIL
jgi:glycosyltransferase involved in cell wall biosynthesis